MRKLLLSSFVAFSGCGAGVSPELYAVVVDFFTLPDSCFTNNAQPSNVTISGPPTSMTVQVWDTAEGALLDVETPRQFDMGDAANVAVGGPVKGKRGTGGWVFTTEASQKLTAGGQTLTTTTRAEFTFERGNTFKGTLALSSSRACSGTSCAAMQPSCTVSPITINGTRLVVNYERAP